jgi:hypothetical protein
VKPHIFHLRSRSLKKRTVYKKKMKIISVSHIFTKLIVDGIKDRVKGKQFQTSPPKKGLYDKDFIRLFEVTFFETNRLILIFA